MAKSEDQDEKKASKGGIVKFVIAGIAMLGIGAGGAYGAFAAGLFGGDAGSSGPDIPQLVRKGDADPFAPPPDGKGKEEPETVYGEGGNEYRTAYYSFEESFTSNLADSSGLIQVDLAASTRRDGRVLQWLQTHELAIRSAILAQLASTPEEDVFDVEGRKRLSQRLTKVINEELEEKEGFGGVDAVHFEAFLIQ